jgi:hypothetical protein
MSRGAALNLIGVILMERATLVTALMIGMMAAMGVAADEPGGSSPPRPP